MSAITPELISQRIINPLKQVSQRQWTVLAGRGILRTLVISLAVLLGVSLLLGYLVEMPAALRIILAATSWVTILVVAIRSLKPAMHRWSLSRAARFAEMSIPDNDERISSAVELAVADERYRGSPELLGHLVKQAEVDAGKVRAAAVAPIKPIFPWFLAFVPVLALWAFSMLYSPQSATLVLRGLLGTFMPWKAPPVVLADLTAQPGNVTIAEGDSVRIVALLGSSGRKAKAVTLIQTFRSTGQSVSVSMDHTDSRIFSRTFENQNQSFSYAIATDRGQTTPMYTVTVNPRPAISRLDITYDYPKYTGISSRTVTVTNGNANIEAVVGTKITLNVQTTAPIVVDKSQIVMNSGRPDQAMFNLTPLADKQNYAAHFDVTQSGDYRIKLLNEYNLSNKEDSAHAIVAQIDQPPTIAITSPKETITIRPDDEVLITYAASDDFGVARVDAALYVDEKPVISVPLTVHAKDRKSFKDSWTMNVAQVLKLAGAPDASRIVYELKATDNREPDAQFTVSEQHTLLVSKDAKKSFEEQLNELHKLELRKAIEVAIARLTSDQAIVASIGDRQRFPLTDDGRKTIAMTRDHVAHTGTDLSAVAGDYLDTPYAEIAKAARQIADVDIAKGAEDTARISLAATADVSVNSLAGTARRELIDSRDALEKLLPKIEEAARKAEAVQDLKDAAKKQEEVAKLMAEHPELADQNLKKQQEAIAKLQEALAKDKSLQDKQAAALAQAQAELQNKIEKDQQKQTELQNQTAQQEEKQQAQTAANALAEEQKKLNEEVKKFAEEAKKPLEQAQTHPPDQQQQDKLVKNIENNQVQQAAADAQKAADQLKNNAAKLQAQAQAPAKNPDQQQQQAQEKATQAKAQVAQKQADKAAAQLNKQAENQQANAEQAKQLAQAVQKAADQIQKQADAVEKNNEQGAKDADVQKKAEAAKADAQQAAQDAQAAANAQDPQEAKDAAQKAAQEIAKAGQEVADAAKAETKANQENAQAQQAQAKRDAAQAADKAADLAKQQAQIAQALAQQAAQQAQAAQAPTPQQAAQSQQNLADATKQAKETAKQLAQQAAAQKDTSLQQRAEQAAKALDQAANAQQEAAKNAADNKTAEAAQNQADAQKALAKADQALRGADPAQAQAAADPANAQAPAQADQNQNAQNAQGQPDQNQNGQGQPQQAQQGQGQPQQTAAQAAQEAAQAQQQALNPNPAAAAQAAQALANAAHAAEHGLPGQEPGNEPGNEPGHEPGKVPHQANDPKHGLAASDTGGDNRVAAIAATVGISADEWAKLPPLMQKQLLSGSQQSSPTAYKEMIKNYFSRIAREQAAQGAGR